MANGKGVQSIRSVLPATVGVLLFGAGAYALYQLLRPVEPAEIAAYFQATPALVLLQVAGATAASYAVLLLYDWYALRYIGKSLPPTVVALAGFLGYAFGNMIGASVVSGGAVRYRVYSTAGLNVFDVAAVSGYVAVALGTGLSLIGLTALAIHPAPVVGFLPYGTAVIQVISGSILATSVTFILWLSVSQRSLNVRRIRLRMPPPRDLAGQAVITMIDVAAAGLALWILLPEGKPDFAVFLAIFSAATMVGVLSHVPGGIGVFETVVIGTMPAAVSVGDSAAALLMFRLIYFVLPFLLGLLVVALNEVRMASVAGRRSFPGCPPAVRSALEGVHGLVPGLVAVTTFGCGAYLLVISMVPAIGADAAVRHDLLGQILLESGALVAAIAGGVLMILSHGLLRRRSSAFWLTVAALFGGAVATWVSGRAIDNALLLVGVALLLISFRASFDRPGRLTQDAFEARWFAKICAVCIAATTFFFFVHKTVPYSSDLWIDFSGRSETPRALRAGLAASAVFFFFGLNLLVRPSHRVRSQEADAVSLEAAAKIVACSDYPQGWLSQTGDKQLLFSESGRSFLMYAVQGRSWIAMGDPVGDTQEFEGLCWMFSELAAQANGRPLFYEVSARHLSLWPELGFALNKVGEEAVVRLDSFTLGGRRFKTMRAALNKRKREGYALDILQPPHSPAVIDRLNAISDAWLASRAGREKGFSVGRFDANYLGHFDIGLVRNNGEAVAFANIMAVDGGRYAAVDLMRYMPEEASGVMEFMFLELLSYYRDRGGEEFSLGIAPLSGLSERSMARSWNRFGRLIYRHGGAFYNFEGLRAFKQKFQPEWRPCYLALPPGVLPLRAIGDAALLIAGKRTQSVRSTLGKADWEDEADREFRRISELKARESAASCDPPETGFQNDALSRKKAGRK